MAKEKKPIPNSQSSTQSTNYWIFLSVVAVLMWLVMVVSFPESDGDFDMEFAIQRTAIIDEENSVGGAVDVCLFYKKQVELHKGHRERYCALAGQNDKYDSICTRYNYAYHEYKLLSQKYCNVEGCMEGSVRLGDYENGDYYSVQKCVEGKYVEVGSS